MKNGSLYKIFAGCFYMLDAKGQKVNYYKDYCMFKNTFGLAFFINSSSTGRCYVIYFAQDNNGWNYRTVFPVGKLIEEENRVCIKTRYNTFVWEQSEFIKSDQIESLYQWVKSNGEKYIPGLTQHSGVKEYFEVGHHY